jgi:CRP-like cAMP-binding protein
MIMAERLSFMPLFAGRPTTNITGGDLLFASGDPSYTMYVIKTGEVRIHEAGRTLEIVGPGGIFGEMALVDRLPRSASATAETDCELIEVDEDLFIATLQLKPTFGLEVMRIVMRRLREANRLLAAG